MNRLNCCKIEKVHCKIDLKRWSRETRRWEVWRGQTQKQDQRAWHMLPWEPRGGQSGVRTENACKLLELMKNTSAKTGSQTHPGRVREKTHNQTRCRKMQVTRQRSQVTHKGMAVRTAASRPAAEARTRGKHPRGVATEQLAPSTASLAKLAFKEEEKSEASLQENKTWVYYYRPILKELKRMYFTSERSKMTVKGENEQKSINIYG